MRLRLGEAPRTFSPDLHAHVTPKVPGWFSNPSEDELGTVFKDSELLLTQGKVVWGSLVMANNLIFAEGNTDLPGVIVYSSEFHRHDDLLRLSDVSEKVSALKAGTRNNAEEKQLGEWLADERTTMLAHPVPKSIAKGDTSLFTSTLLFFREHLPGNNLATGYFPILTHPSSKAVMVLPGSFWPKEFISNWMNQE